MAHRREHGISQTSKKMIAAHVILKNLLALDTPNDQMVESARHVNAGFSAHGGTVPETFFLVNLETYAPLFAIRLNRWFTQNRRFLRGSPGDHPMACGTSRRGPTSGFFMDKKTIDW